MSESSTVHRIMVHMYGTSMILTNGKIYFMLGVGWNWFYLVRLPLAAYSTKPPEDTEIWSNRWNEIWQEKTCRGLTTFTTKFVWPGLGENSGHRGWKQGNNHLSYDTSSFEVCSCPETLNMKSYREGERKRPKFLEFWNTWKGIRSFILWLPCSLE